MTVESDADRLSMLDDWDAATYLGGQISGIFNAEYIEIGDNEAAIESSQPNFLCREIDVSGIAHGAMMSIKGSTYKVVGVQPDGAGLTLLMLEEQ